MLFVVAMLFAGKSFAQTDQELERARKQFQDAMALQAAGDCAGALVQLEAVARVKTTPHVRFNIALCQERLGKLVSAAGNYRLALEEAEAGSIKEVAEPARASLDALDKRIPTITVVRAKGAEEVTISLDGVVLGDAAIGPALRRDPGFHSIVAKSGKRRVFERSIKLAEGEHQRIEVDAGPAEPEPDTGISSHPAASAEPAAPDHTAAYVIGGIGAASLVAGGVFFFLRQKTIDDLDDDCDGLRCPQSEQETIDRGRLYTGLTEGAAVVAAAALTTAVVLYVDGTPRRESVPSRSGVAVAIGAGARGGTVRFQGRF